MINSNSGFSLCGFFGAQDAEQPPAFPGLFAETLEPEPGPELLHNPEAHPADARAFAPPAWIPRAHEEAIAAEMLARALQAVLDRDGDPVRALAAGAETLPTAAAAMNVLRDDGREEPRIQAESNAAPSSRVRKRIAPPRPRAANFRTQPARGVMQGGAPHLVLEVVREAAAKGLTGAEIREKVLHKQPTLRPRTVNNAIRRQCEEEGRLVPVDGRYFLAPSQATAPTHMAARRTGATKDRAPSARGVRQGSVPHLVLEVVREAAPKGLTGAEIKEKVLHKQPTLRPKTVTMAIQRQCEEEGRLVLLGGRYFLAPPKSETGAEAFAVKPSVRGPLLAFAQRQAQAWRVKDAWVSLVDGGVGCSYDAVRHAVHALVDDGNVRKASRGTYETCAPDHPLPQAPAVGSMDDPAPPQWRPVRQHVLAFARTRTLDWSASEAFDAILDDDASVRFVEVHAAITELLGERRLQATSAGRFELRTEEAVGPAHVRQQHFNAEPDQRLEDNPTHEAAGARHSVSRALPLQQGGGESTQQDSHAPATYAELSRRVFETTGKRIPRSTLESRARYGGFVAPQAVIVIQPCPEDGLENLHIHAKAGVTLQVREGVGGLFGMATLADGGTRVVEGHAFLALLRLMVGDEEFVCGDVLLAFLNKHGDPTYKLLGTAVSQLRKDFYIVYDVSRGWALQPSPAPAASRMAPLAVEASVAGDALPINSAEPPWAQADTGSMRMLRCERPYWADVVVQIKRDRPGWTGREIANHLKLVHGRIAKVGWVNTVLQIADARAKRAAGEAPDDDAVAGLLANRKRRRLDALPHIAAPVPLVPPSSLHEPPSTPATAATPLMDHAATGIDPFTSELAWGGHPAAVWLDSDSDSGLEDEGL